MRVARMVLVMGLCLAAFPAVTAQAQGDNPLIGRGQELYDELRYDEALQVLSAALIRPGNSRDQDITIYRLLAFTYLALRREEEADGAWRRLLAIDAAQEPGMEVSPRFREFFDAAKERWEAEGRPGAPPPTPVTIQHRSPAQADRGEAVELRAAVEDPGNRLSSLVLAYRQGTEAVFRRLDMTPAGAEFVATIPGEDIAPPLVEYYLEGLDAANLPIAARGDVAAPLRIAVPEPGKTIWGRWWFWVAAAAVVGGAITLAVVLARDTSPSQGTLLITVR